MSQLIGKLFQFFELPYLLLVDYILEHSEDDTKSLFSIIKVSWRGWLNLNDLWYFWTSCGVCSCKSWAVLLTGTELCLLVHKRVQKLCTDHMSNKNMFFLGYFSDYQRPFALQRFSQARVRLPLEELQPCKEINGKQSKLVFSFCFSLSIETLC